MSKIVHGIHFPVSAKSFIVPIVEGLNNHGLDAELWLENSEEHRDVVASIEVPRKIIESDLILNPLKLIQRLQSYREAIQKIHPSIIHTHQSRSSLIPLLASKIEQVPVRIYHNHGLPYLGYQGLTRWLLRLLEVINISLATDVLMVSQSNLDAAIEDQLIDNKRGKVIGSGSICGIDLAKYNVHNFDDYSQLIAREKLGIDRNSFVLAYVGRPHKRKGFDRLLTAWQESKLGVQGNVLLMAGCKDADVRLRLGDNEKGVMAIGYTDDMIQFYAACDAVVLPSDHEGFPYGLLEAAAAGKALIGSDIPGISCAIKHDKTGLLVSLDDVNGLKDAIVKIASNPDLRKEFGKNARERVEKEFDREIVLNELLSFYSLLQSKNSPLRT